MAPSRQSSQPAPSSESLEVEVELDMSSAAPPAMDVGEATEWQDRSELPGEEVDPHAANAERALEAMTNFRLAETALQRGDMQLAERLAQKAAEGDPEQAEYVALYAWVRAMGASPNQVNDAIDTISRVLTHEPTCERALLYRGKLYKRANKAREALRDFEALLKINPKHREAASEVRLLRMHTK